MNSFLLITSGPGCTILQESVLPAFGANKIKYNEAPHS